MWTFWLLFQRGNIIISNKECWSSTNVDTIIIISISSKSSFFSPWYNLLKFVNWSLTTIAQYFKVYDVLWWWSLCHHQIKYTCFEVNKPQKDTVCKYNILDHYTHWCYNQHVICLWIWALNEFNIKGIQYHCKINYCYFFLWNITY